MRLENSIRNIIFGLGGYLLNILIGFITRTVFINILGTNYLGISGLFSNILTFLSLTELGIGTAIVFSLYKPLADKDEYKISALMNLYRRAYRLIGGIILIIGLMLVPFLNILIKDVHNIPNIEAIYILFLLQSVASYLFFSYKSAILNASQNNYIISKYGYIYSICNGIMQVIILNITKNYILMLSLQILIDIIRNILISKEVNKIYPYLIKNKNIHLEKCEIKKLYKDIYALSLSKVCGIVLNATDNIVISYFLGVVQVGIYSNYIYIINNINSILNIVFNSLTSSVGNLNATSDEEQKYFIYKVMNFIVFWFYGFCSICFLELLNPFISIWIGEKFLFDKIVVASIVLNFYTSGMQYTNTIYKDACGLFWNTRYRSLSMAVINIIFSIILVQYLGVMGVLLGTIISRLLTNFWFDPWTIHRNIFKKTTKRYFSKYFIYTLSVIVAGILTSIINSFWISNEIISFLMKAITCAIIPNLIFILLFFKTTEFKYLKDIILDKILYKVTFKLKGFRIKYDKR